MLVNHEYEKQQLATSTRKSDTFPEFLNFDDLLDAKNNRPEIDCHGVVKSRALLRLQ